MKHIKKFENLDTPHTMDVIAERKQIIQSVIDCLVNQQNNKPGFQSFKEELKDFLSSFPKE